MFCKALVFAIANFAAVIIVGIGISYFS